MTATVDDEKRVRITTATPKSRFWIVPKSEGRYELIPAPVEPERKKMTREQVREAIKRSPLKFTMTSEQLKAETRE